jgi:hypothetical protein
MKPMVLSSAVVKMPGASTGGMISATAVFRWVFALRASRNSSPRFTKVNRWSPYALFCT